MQNPSIDVIRPAPRPPEKFTGRERQITKIIEEIAAPGSNARIALLGMGGVGKSAMAKQIAALVSSHFPGGIFWGEELPEKGDPATLLKGWGRRCGQNMETVREEDLVELVRGLLHAHKAQAGPILVVVDDARLDWTQNGIRTIEEALPGDTPLLITTRQEQVAQEIRAKRYLLNVLSRRESCRLLATLSDNKITGADAREIAELCGDMPLALRLAASRTPEKKRELFLQRLRDEANRLDLLKLDQASRKEQSVRITLESSYRGLTEQHPETARIFRMLGAFARPTFVILQHLVDAFVPSSIQRPAGQPSVTSGRHHPQNLPRASMNYEQEVFVSYAWGGESEQTVDQLERAFANRAIRLVRDKGELDFRDSIREFEERIGGGQCVVLVISDKYLRSKHCMYELLQVQEYQALRERIFPIVLKDARLYTPVGRLGYFQYWDEQIDELNRSIKQINVVQNLQSVLEELNMYVRIRANLDHLADLLGDMNALTLEIHSQSGFSALIDQVERTMSELRPEKYARSIEDRFRRLVSWSLLQEDEDIENDQAEYFQMHTLLHEYAQSILAERKEIEEAIRIHIRYCVAFAEANPQLDLQRQQRSTLEFEKMYGQLLHALAQIKEHYLPKVADWKAEPELCRQIIALVAALDHHWHNHSQFADQTEWLEVAYTCAGALGDTIREGDFARRLGRAMSWQRNLDEALAWMSRGAKVLEGVRDEEANPTQALLYIHRAAVHFQQRAFEKAEDDCIRGLDLVDMQKHPRIYAEGSNLLGVVLGATGKLKRAIDVLEKSLSTWKMVGDQYQIFRTEDNLRTAYFYLGDIANARRAEDNSLKYWEQFPNRIELAMALTNRGLIDYRYNGYEKAIRLHQRAMEMSDRLEVQRMRAMTRVNLAWPYIALHEYDKADAVLQESIEIQGKYDTKEYWIEAHRALAEVELGRGHYDKAMDLAQKALKQARKNEEALEEGTALRILGQACHSNRALKQAREYLEASQSILKEDELKYEAYLTLLALIPVYQALGESEKEQWASEEVENLIREMGLNIPAASTRNIE